MRFFAHVLVICSLLFSAEAWAQRSEVGFLLGGTVVPFSTPRGQGATGSTDDIHAGLAFQATYAYLRPIGHQIQAGVEVPFVAIPSQNVISTNPSTPRNYASLFITPGFRLRFLADRRVSPWLAVGGGYVRFDESSTLTAGGPNVFSKGTNTGALQFGGGIDFKTPLHVFKPLGLRAEIRDFYSGSPQLRIPGQESRQHNVVVSGGFVVHF